MERTEARTTKEKAKKLAKEENKHLKFVSVSVRQRRGWYGRKIQKIRVGKVVQRHQDEGMHVVQGPDDFSDDQVQPRTWTELRPRELRQKIRFTERETRGEMSSWCRWCWRVITSKAESV